jgi:hypothetical protein
MLLALIAWAAMTGDASASLAGLLWSFPATGSTIVASSGSQLDSECVDLSRDGVELWALPDVMGSAPSCIDAVTDSAGNSYLFTSNDVGKPVVDSVDAGGASRWSTPVGDFSPWRTTPVLGADGSVYFSATNGSGSEVLGLDMQTGTITLEKGFYDVTGLHAYSGGLVVVNTDSEIFYLDYEGNVQHEYRTEPAITAYAAYSNAGGPSGAVFVAGYNNWCSGSSHASVEKFTPAGLAWNWTDPTVYCSQTLLASTPGGGVIFGRAETEPGADYTSIGVDGKERWTDSMSGPTGIAENGGYLPVLVDVNGTVALPARVTYSCSRPFHTECPAAQVEYLSEGSGAPVLPTLLIQGSSEGGFSPYSVATDSDRTYITAEAIEDDQSSESGIFAFQTPGLGKDYQLALREAVAAGEEPPSTGTPPSGSVIGDPSSTRQITLGSGSSGNPCGVVRGGFVKRLLAAAKCTWAQTVMEVKCGVAVAGFLFIPLKSLRLAKTAGGLLDLRKLAKKFRPAAKLYNDLSLVKYTKAAPRGFGTPKETLATIENIGHIGDLVNLLPDLRRALSAADFNQISLDIADVAGLKPCVQGLADAMAG